MAVRISFSKMARALVAGALVMGSVVATTPALAHVVEVTTALEMPESQDASAMKAALQKAVERVLADTIAFKPTMVALTDARVMGEKLLPGGPWLGRAAAVGFMVWGGATILGVGFFDPSPVDGAAPNDLGLAPAVHFESADCSIAGPVSPTTTPRRIGSPAATWTASPTPLPGATATRTPTPSPTAPPTTYGFSGTDSRQSTAYALTAGRWSFSYTFTGAILNAYLLDAGGTNRGTIVACSASCQDTHALTIPADGSYRIQVNAAGSWSFTFRAG